MKRSETHATPATATGRLTGKLKEFIRSVFPLFKKNYTYISAGISLQGDLIAEENVVLDGRMSGNIRSSKHLSMGPTSHFEGEIESESAVISGYLKGRIVTRQTLVVQVPATIIGDLVSASVEVESGVVLNGKIVSDPRQTQPLQDDAREEVFATLAEPVESR